LLDRLQLILSLQLFIWRLGDGIFTQTPRLHITDLMEQDENSKSEEK
jgi:hypothetical protein